MIQKPTPKRDARTDGFIDSMLKSASEKTETSAQTRFGDVDPKEIEGVFKAIQKGKFRRD
ncbi:MAG: hypothetical protein WCV90_03125 [Candidatus Woesearchaeota archaeon]